MSEQWAKWSNAYEVSTLGRVRSLMRLSRLRRAYGGNRIMTQQTTPNGYLVVYLCENDVRMRRYVHRLVLETFVGPCPKGQWAAHNNGIRTDCRLSNLRWDTVKGNHADKLKHGTIVRGEFCHNAVLTASMVRRIRMSDLPDRKLALLLGVSHGAVEKARTYKTWKHI